MGKGRLEAFSDGVLAIIITIMVLEVKVPHGAHFEALRSVWPQFASYLVSFVYVGIYWSNHHHLIHAVKRVDGWIMWANMHLLFWLSMVPVTTAWIGENLGEPLPVAAYGVVLFMAGIAYLLLERAIVREHPEIAAALGSDFKGKVSGIGYLVSIPLAYVSHWIAIGIYIAIAVLWFVPDRRMVSVVEKREA